MRQHCSQQQITLQDWDPLCRCRASLVHRLDEIRQSLYSYHYHRHRPRGIVLQDRRHPFRYFHHPHGWSHQNDPHRCWVCFEMRVGWRNIALLFSGNTSIISPCNLSYKGLIRCFLSVLWQVIIDYLPIHETIRNKKRWNPCKHWLSRNNSSNKWATTHQISTFLSYKSATIKNGKTKIN